MRIVVDSTLYLRVCTCVSSQERRTTGIYKLKGFSGVSRDYQNFRDFPKFPEFPGFPRDFGGKIRVFFRGFRL